MRIVLVGPPSDRARLRAEVRAAGMEIVGEAETLAAGRRTAGAVDAFVVSPAAVETVRRTFDDTLDDDRGPAGHVEEALTPRELDVLRLLALGLPNRQIAARLGISDQTVKFHVASILAKLGAANRTDVVRRAVRRGLIDL